MGFRIMFPHMSLTQESRIDILHNTTKQMKFIDNLWAIHFSRVNLASNKMLTRPMLLSRIMDVFIFTKQFFCKIIYYCIYIWNQNGKQIKMSTNKPIFGSMVLEKLSTVHYFPFKTDRALRTRVFLLSDYRIKMCLSLVCSLQYAWHSLILLYHTSSMPSVTSFPPYINTCYH